MDPISFGQHTTAALPTATSRVLPPNATRRALYSSFLLAVAAASCASSFFPQKKRHQPSAMEVISIAEMRERCMVHGLAIYGSNEESMFKCNFVLAFR